METCLIIRGVVTDDEGNEEKFRPGTPSPDKHWTYLLMDQYRHLLNMSIQWVENEPMVSVTKESHKESEEAFVHVMKFAKLHNLDATWCERKCAECAGHIDCLSENSKR